MKPVHQKFFSLIISFTTFLLMGNVKAQGINNLWLLGYDSGTGLNFGGTNIDFSQSPTSVYPTYRNMNFYVGNSNISDINGNLLFYTNGIYIADRLDSTMLNGTNFNPGFCTFNFAQMGLPIAQGILILPHPTDSQKYYIVHESCQSLGTTYQPLDLSYTLVDMQMNSGLGAVTQKHIVIFSDTLILGGLTACKHANGRDWWIICPAYLSNEYYKLLLTPSGISVAGIQNIGPLNGPNDWSGQSNFSPDGSKYVRVDRDSGVLIFDFDRCSGLLSNSQQILINDSALARGSAISSDSRILYVSSMQYVYQFDLTASNIATTQTTVATWDGFYSPQPPFATTFYLAQLEPNGKIYIICPNGTQDIHVINSPDSLGSNCDLQQHSFHLPTYNAETCNTHPNYFLGCDTASGCQCLTTSIEESGKHDFKFNLFPNPITERKPSITYLLPQNKSGKLELFDVNGKVVFKYNLPQWSTLQSLTLPKLSNGIYNCVITSAGERTSKKIMVVND